MTDDTTPLPLEAVTLAPCPFCGSEAEGEVLKFLIELVDRTSVGKHNEMVSTRSKHANYPASLWYKAKALISRIESAKHAIKEVNTNYD